MGEIYIYKGKSLKKISFAARVKNKKNQIINNIEPFD